jgi:tetratricopeptide (TPR) repeat protein
VTASSSIPQSLLDSLWDFNDPTASADRFRRAVDDEQRSLVARAELATQLARALGLLGRFDEAEALLDAIVLELDEAPEVVLARAALERGRLRVAAERTPEGVPLFTLAARHAAAAGSKFLALDALHMLALADPGHEEEWAAEGFSVLGTVADPRVRRWGVALHNNLAWHLHDTGRPAEALPHFEQALATAEECGTDDQRFIGRWAVGRCLRSLGRYDEALSIQEGLAAERPDDPFAAAELAELGAPGHSEETAASGKSGVGKSGAGKSGAGKSGAAGESGAGKLGVAGEPGAEGESGESQARAEPATPGE